MKKICGLCSKKLNFLSTAIATKTSDGVNFCSKCFRKINYKDSRIAFHIKKYSIKDIHNLFNGQNPRIERLERLKKEKEAKKIEKEINAKKEKEKKQERLNCVLCLSRIGVKVKLRNSNRIRICPKCYKKVKSADHPNAGIGLKNYSLEDIKNLVQKGGHKEERIQKMLEKLKQSGYYKTGFWERREIKTLPDIIAEEEEIDNMVGGIYGKTSLLDIGGLLVSTNRRLFFVDKGLYGLQVEDFPLDTISSIGYESHILSGAIVINTFGNSAAITNIVPKTYARIFAEFVRDKLWKLKNQSVQTNTKTEPNILEQIEKLGKLKESGILSEEEFTEQKKKLLHKL